jgi:hypothetical protein
MSGPSSGAPTAGIGLHRAEEAHRSVFFAIVRAEAYELDYKHREQGLAQRQGP